MSSVHEASSADYEDWILSAKLHATKWGQVLHPATAAALMLWALSRLDSRRGSGPVGAAAVTSTSGRTLLTQDAEGERGPSSDCLGRRSGLLFASLHPPATLLEEGAIASHASHETIERRRSLLLVLSMGVTELPSVIHSKSPTPINPLGSDELALGSVHGQASTPREWVSGLMIRCQGQGVMCMRVEHVQFPGSPFHFIQYLEHLLYSCSVDISGAPNTSPSENHPVS